MWSSAREKIPSDPVVGRVRGMVAGQGSYKQKTLSVTRNYGRCRGMVAGEGGRSTGVLLYNILSTKHFHHSRKSGYNVSQCIRSALCPTALPALRARLPDLAPTHCRHCSINGMSTARLAAITLLCGASHYYTVMLRGGGLLEHGNKKTTRDLRLFLLEVTPRSAVLLRRQGMSVTV